MNPPLRRWLSLADVILLPAFIVWFIWQLQFTARGTWVIFVVWLVASFLLHRDTAKTLGWRGDNIWPATKQALVVFGLMAAGLVITGFLLVRRDTPAEFNFVARAGGLLRVLRVAAGGAQFTNAQPDAIARAE